MVKDQHPQAAKEAAGNVLPSWLDAFKVLLDLDPEQDVSGENWDGLEIRFQIFKVRTTLFPSSEPHPDLAEGYRLSRRYKHHFLA
jgi:importin-9